MKNSKFLSTVVLLGVIIIVLLVSGFVVFKDIASILPKRDTVNLSIGQTYVVKDSNLKIDKTTVFKKINYDFSVNSM